MVGQDVELQEREQELYTVLLDWPDVQAIMVGGYAASAWSFQRLSRPVATGGSGRVECDWLGRSSCDL